MRAGPRAARAAIHRQALAPKQRLGLVVGVQGLGFRVQGLMIWGSCLWWFDVCGLDYGIVNTHESGVCGDGAQLCGSGLREVV